MALPASLLSQLERHGCFSGCYGGELDARVCLDPAQTPESAVFISCRDCLTFKVGALRSLLSPLLTAEQLAEQVTRHLRGVRGFRDSFGGYHMRGGGFWLNAVYYDGGLFLVDGARSRAAGSDLDLLLLAFRHGVAQPADPRMVDPQHYATQVVYVDYSQPLSPIQSKQDLLSSAQCRTQPASGFHRVTLAEFLPLSTQPGAPVPNPATAVQTTPPAAPMLAVAAPPFTPAAGPSHGAPHAPGLPGIAARAGRARKAGEICPVCQAEIRERPLFTGTYLGCLC